MLMAQASPADFDPFKLKLYDRERKTIAHSGPVHDTQTRVVASGASGAYR